MYLQSILQTCGMSCFLVSFSFVLGDKMACKLDYTLYDYAPSECKKPK